MALYLRLIGARVRGQLQYRGAFLANIVGYTLLTGLEFASIWVLLTRFGAVGGWSLAEVALLYGLTASANGIAQTVARGFDGPFEKLIMAGGLDTLLVRPAGAFFQVLASEFSLRTLGRTVQAGAVLVWAIGSLNIEWDLAKIVLVPLTILAGTLIYASIAVIGATVTIWTIKTPEVVHIATSGAQQLVSYPLHIYSEALRFVFLAIIPVAFSAYPCALWLLERGDPHGLPAALAWAAPLVALGFGALTLVFWRVGLARYQSTGT